MNWTCVSRDLDFKPRSLAQDCKDAQRSLTVHCMMPRPGPPPPWLLLGLTPDSCMRLPMIPAADCLVNPSPINMFQTLARLLDPLTGDPVPTPFSVWAGPETTPLPGPTDPDPALAPDEPEATRSAILDVVTLMPAVLTEMSTRLPATAPDDVVPCASGVPLPISEARAAPPPATRRMPAR